MKLHDYLGTYTVTDKKKSFNILFVLSNLKCEHKS